MSALRVRLLVVTVALLLAACGSGTPKLQRLGADAVVLAFGDSLTYGTGATPETNYATQLSALIGRKVVAHGVPGEVSAQGLARLPAVLDEVQPRLLILCHGGNDILRRLDERAAANNLRAMIKLAKSRGVDVVLVGVPKPGLMLSTAAWYEDVAKEAGLPYEAKAISSILGDSELKADLVHPNARGYGKLAEAIAALLKKAGAV